MTAGGHPLIRWDDIVDSLKTSCLTEGFSMNDLHTLGLAQNPRFGFPVFWSAYKFSVFEEMYFSSYYGENAQRGYLKPNLRELLRNYCIEMMIGQLEIDGPTSQKWVRNVPEDTTGKILIEIHEDYVLKMLKKTLIQGSLLAPVGYSYHPESVLPCREGILHTINLHLIGQVLLGLDLADLSGTVMSKILDVLQSQERLQEKIEQDTEKSEKTPPQPSAAVKQAWRIITLVRRAGRVRPSSSDLEPLFGEVLTTEPQGPEATHETEPKLAHILEDMEEPEEFSGVNREILRSLITAAREGKHNATPYRLAKEAVRAEPNLSLYLNEENQTHLQPTMEAYW